MKNKEAILKMLNEIDEFVKDRPDRNIQVRTEFIRNELTGKAKWLCLEEGGWACAHCGYTTSGMMGLLKIKKCPKCKSIMEI